MQTIASAMQTSSMTPELESHHQMYYQSEGNLIQIAPHDPCANMMNSIENRAMSPISDRRDMSPTNEHSENAALLGPEGEFVLQFGRC